MDIRPRVALPVPRGEKGLSEGSKDSADDQEANTPGQERARIVRKLFDRVVDLPPLERAAVLDRKCGDAQIRREVESLLAAHDKAGSFLGDPTVPPQDLGVIETFSPGVRIDKYTIIEKIGEGGYGAVFLAQQESPLRRRVALKVIKAGMDTRQVVARFELERESLAIMNHPGIARALDAGATENGRPYFVMELVEGKPITEFCRDFELDFPTRLRLFQSVCSAVHHAHGKGVIHRDLKPGNVLVAMLDGNPVPKVIDFGIAKALTSEDGIDPRMTIAGPSQFMGTPQYISPEQAAGRTDEIDARTDVYSLGSLLYEMLTDAAPFDADSMQRLSMSQIQEMIQHQDPVRPSVRLASRIGSETASTNIRPAQLRGDLDWIVMKAMEKSPARRYESADAVSNDIERYLTDQPINARPPSIVYRAGKFVRRHRIELALATMSALALLAIATAIAIVMVMRNRRLVAVALAPTPPVQIQQPSPATLPVVHPVMVMTPPATLPATRPAVVAPTFVQRTLPTTQSTIAMATQPAEPIFEALAPEDQPVINDDQPDAPSGKPAAPLEPGLVAEIFQNGQFENLKDKRIDAQIDFDWPPHVPPEPGMSTPRYSIRWTGVLLIPQGGILGIGFNASSGGRVYLNDKQIIGFLTKGNVRNKRIRIAGRHDLKVEYWNRAGGGHAHLYWILPNNEEQIIPPEALWHYDNPSQ
jgi:serine/threonine protein kinase